MHVVYHGYMTYMEIKNKWQQKCEVVATYVRSQEREGTVGDRQTDRHIDTEIQGERQTDTERERARKNGTQCPDPFS